VIIHSGLTVTDNQGATDFNDLIVRVVSSTNNLPPVVDAGPDIRIFLPQNTLIINASASDDGTISAYQWAKLGGPTATLVNPTEQNLSLTNLIEGEYTFQIAVTDNNGATVFDIVRVSLLPSTFAPPIADAGVDQEITLPANSVNITGTATSPTGSIVSTIWTKTLGPTATLTGATTLSLQVTNMLAGTYVFTLKVTDNTGKESSDNIEVVVNPIPPNQAPTVSAGSNTNIILPTSQVILTGTAVDSDGSVSSLKWTQLAGPSTANFQNETTLTLTASNLVAGAYTFKLEAVDNLGKVGFNYVIIFVAPETGSGNLPPIVFAGEDVTLIQPDNEVSIIGTALDPEGTSISSLIWEQVGGESVPFNVSNRSILNITDLVAGSYTFRLSATDDDQLTSSDEVQISVIEQSQEIPKFFSPNGDGYGETWVVRNIESYQICGLVVFARSGQTVLEARPYQNNWDGTYNGKPLNDGDYYYTFNCDDGRIIKGALRIIR
jgi:gliding motility-associated-like protein